MRNFETASQSLRLLKFNFIKKKANVTLSPTRDAQKVLTIIYVNRCVSTTVSTSQALLVAIQIQQISRQICLLKFPVLFRLALLSIQQQVQLDLTSTA